MLAITLQRKAISALLSLCLLASSNSQAQNMTSPLHSVPVSASPPPSPHSYFTVYVGVVGAFSSMSFAILSVSIAFWALLTRDPFPLSSRITTDSSTHSGLFNWLYGFGLKKSHSVEFSALLSRFLHGVEHRYIIFHQRRPSVFNTAVGVAVQTSRAMISFLNLRKDHWYKWQHKFALGDHLKSYRTFPAAMAAAHGDVHRYTPLPMSLHDPLPLQFTTSPHYAELFYYLRSFQVYALQGWLAYLSGDFSKLWLDMGRGQGIFVDFNHNPEPAGLTPFPHAPASSLMPLPLFAPATYPYAHNSFLPQPVGWFDPGV